MASVTTDMYSRNGREREREYSTVTLYRGILTLSRVSALFLAHVPNQEWPAIRPT